MTTPDAEQATSFKRINLDEWYEYRKDRLVEDAIRQSNQYLMLSLVDGPSDFTGDKEVKAGVSLVEITEFNPEIQTTPYHLKGWHALKATFVTDAGDHYLTLSGIFDQADGHFVPSKDRQEADILERSTKRVVGRIGNSYFLAPSDNPLKWIREPRTLQELRTPDKSPVILT